jgi:membrane protein
MSMKFFRLLYRALIIWIQGDAEVHAAALAYFAIFALTPLLLLSITLVGMLIGGPEVIALLLSWGNTLDPGITELLSSSVQNFTVITTAYYVPLVAILFFSSMIIIALNSLSSGLSRITNSAHHGWRNLLKRTARSLVFVMILQAYLVCIILLNRTILFISQVPLVHVLEFLYPFLIFVSTLILFTVGYGMLSLRTLSLPARFYGAVVSSSLFLFTRELVALHTLTTPIPDLFGAAGLIIVMLVWIYVSASILFYGAAFAMAYEEYSSPVRVSTKQ